MRKIFIIYMGKQLEKLILILGMIILGSVALAQPPVDVLSGENTPVVTRERKVPKPKKEVKQNIQAPKQEKQAKNESIKIKKKSKKPQVAGLKIYDIERPKQPTKKSVKKVACKQDPTSPCNIRKAKPITSYIKVNPPRYTKDRYVNNRYSDRYKKSRLPQWQPLQPAKPIPIITCY